MSMSPETVRLLRNFLWADSDSLRPIPPVLCEMHEFAYTRLHRYCCQNRLTPDALMCLLMNWKYNTEEGRAFYGDEKKASSPPAPPVDWYTIPAGTPVVAHGKRGSLLGMTEKKRVQFKTEDGTVATYWPSEVQLAN